MYIFEHSSNFVFHCTRYWYPAYTFFALSLRAITDRIEDRMLTIINHCDCPVPLDGRRGSGRGEGEIDGLTHWWGKRGAWKEKEETRGISRRGYRDREWGLRLKSRWPRKRDSPTTGDFGGDRYPHRHSWTRLTRGCHWASAASIPAAQSSRMKTELADRKKSVVRGVSESSVSERWKERSWFFEGRTSTSTSTSERRYDRGGVHGTDVPRNQVNG